MVVVFVTTKLYNMLHRAYDLHTNETGEEPCVIKMTQNTHDSLAKFFGSAGVTEFRGVPVVVVGPETQVNGFGFSYLSEGANEQH